MSRLVGRAGEVFFTAVVEGGVEVEVEVEDSDATTLSSRLSIVAFTSSSSRLPVFPPSTVVTRLASD